MKLNSHKLPITKNDLLSHYACPFEYDPTQLKENEGYFIYREGKGRKEMSTEKKEFKSGATSTKSARLDLLPMMGLICAADRFELGLERHPTGCYNALTNQKPLEDIDWLIERASHTIKHCYRIIYHIKHGKMEDAYGDAGAVSFGGLILGEAIARAKMQERTPTDGK